MDFDLPSEWEYMEHVRGIFKPYGTEFYYVELTAPQEVRLKRNVSENRPNHQGMVRCPFHDDRFVEACQMLDYIEYVK